MIRDDLGVLEVTIFTQRKAMPFRAVGVPLISQIRRIFMRMMDLLTV